MEKNKHDAQEVQDATPAPDVLELTRKAMQRDIRNLAGFADAREKPEAEQEAAYYAYLEEHAQEVQDATDKEQLTFTLPEVAPELNPDSPQFDIEAYKKAIEEAGGFPVLADYLEKTLRDDYGETMQKLAAAGGQAAAAALAGDWKNRLEKSTFKIASNLPRAAALAVANSWQGVAEALTARQAGLQAALEEYRAIAEKAQKMLNENRARLEAEARKQWPEFDDAPDNMQLFAVFLVADLEKAEAEGLDLEGLNVAQIMQEGFTSEWEAVKTSRFYELIERVEARALTAEEARHFLEEIRESKKSTAAEEAALIKAGQLTFDGLHYPIDKLTETILQAGSYDDTGQFRGQITKMGGNVPDVKMIMSIDDDLKSLVDKPLTYRRALALSAWYNLLLAGATSWTIDDLIKWTGKKNINASDRKAFRKEIDILAATNLRAEQEGFGTGTHEKPRFATGGKLLAYSYIETDAKGAAGGGFKYYPYKPPKEEEGGPLLAFAERLGQVAYYPAAVLDTPSSKNEDTYKREDYFRKRVAHFRNATPTEQIRPELSKIKYSTYFEKFGITDKKKRQREKKYIESLLDYWTEINWIGGYKKSRDAITLQPPKEGGLKAIEAPKKPPKK